MLGFLTDADERMLLRRTGGGYQFPHRTMQEHVADRDPETVPEHRGSSSARPLPSR
jgi:hypothetical protein